MSNTLLSTFSFIMFAVVLLRSLSGMSFVTDAAMPNSAASFSIVFSFKYVQNFEPTSLAKLTRLHVRPGTRRPRNQNCTFFQYLLRGGGLTPLGGLTPS